MSKILVLLQFLSILMILLSAPVFCNYLGLLVLEILGICIVFIALYNMKGMNFNISPKPKTSGKLCTIGVYKFIRHPMYLATLLIMLSLVINYYSTIRVGFYLILVTVLILKLNYEEKLLVKQFPEYKKYQTSNWRLLPFFY